MNTYMNDQKQCSDCPDHSQTAIIASTDIKMCNCQYGYNGPPGGTCTGQYFLSLQWMTVEWGQTTDVTQLIH